MSERIELDQKQVRRLALLRAGLLRPEWLELPSRARASGASARARCRQWIDHFGYLQLDTVSVAGARTHGIVLASRLAGLDANEAERLLRPGEPLFEYWGHEACWMPMSSYPLFGFRRKAYQVHPWWGDILREHAGLARELLERTREQGPFRSVDLEGERRSGWWDLKLSKRVAEALWSAGDLAIAERRNFQRIYDLTERVVPSAYLDAEVGVHDAFRALLLRALAGHGFAPTGILASTWRLRNVRPDIDAALASLRESGDIVACDLVMRERRLSGWLLRDDLELIDGLSRARIHGASGVLLSPFDPLLWERSRVRLLFGFDQRIEIYKPAQAREFGYYCLPVLAGERLIGRVDLKAQRQAGELQVAALHREAAPRRFEARDRAAIDSALTRFAGSVGLRLVR